MAKQSGFQKGVAWVKKQTKRKRTSSRKMGLGGKAGAIILGTTPIIIPTLRVIRSQSIYNTRYPNQTMMNKAEVGVKQWLNGFCTQFNMPIPFDELTIVSENGTTATVTTRGSQEEGKAWGLMGAGLVAIGIDRVSSFLAGGGTKIPGTHILAVGTKK